MFIVDLAIDGAEQVEASHFVPDARLRCQARRASPVAIERLFGFDPAADTAGFGKNDIRKQRIALHVVVRRAGVYQLDLRNPRSRYPLQHRFERNRLSCRALSVDQDVPGGPRIAPDFAIAFNQRKARQQQKHLISVGRLRIAKKDRLELRSAFGVLSGGRCHRAKTRTKKQSNTKSDCHRGAPLSEQQQGLLDERYPRPALTRERR
ncbi:hypothetical protein KNJ79_15460 [Sphingopyxis indica]|uniref:hypothetical protein n=1 Tax=Sphingopyxis indica TaxID=436663 RepID=UPI0029392EEB|nr:hypothetical protein [Sphingopyxis indica]WOF42560.1 hypothetical protein KNJ79_15460 [Sphingopyxis indica]